jgi:hypothetical protein
MQYVLIRDNMAGVFFGELADMDLAAGTWTLKLGRKIHYWRRAGAVEGVAVRGIDPLGSRVTAACRVSGRAMVQVVYLTAEQHAALDAVPEWRP